MKRVLMITEDGSHTIYIPDMDEHYHSVHGAIQESLHIYIEQGLLQTTKTDLYILEIGFGTGLNAYLTYCYSQERNISVNYICLEKYPLNEAEYSVLNYSTAIFSEYSPIFNLLHKSEWNETIEIPKNFKFKKNKADLLNFQFDEVSQFDLVYYDAFAPGKQPEMWTDQLLHKVAATVKPDGIIVTYCAKGAVRRSLADAGFSMERISGPTGKKEILRGKKTF